jgi:3-phosphoshikimate 1-carboxyvinyltransferase
LLLAALSSKTKITIVENIPSRDHTERMLEECGADIKRDGNKIILDGSIEIKKKFIDVPKDFSSAAYLIAANILSKKNILLEGVGVNSTRTAFLDVVQEMGGNVVLKNIKNITNEPRADIESNAKQELKGISIQGKKIPNLIDEIPLIAIMGLFAKGQTTVRDAKELRFKESDRISLLLSNIKKFDPKATVTEYEDGFDINPSNNLDTESVNIETGGDHRIIMSFMIASLGSGKKVVFDETSSVETSFPGFFEVLEKWYQ